MNIKAVVIDDEVRSRETIKGLLTRYCPNVEVIGEADGISSAKILLSKKTPDIVFLDIQMPEGSGFNLLDSLEKREFKVIFTTAYDQFAIKAFKYSAVDYLLKPIIPDDLIQAVEKVNLESTEDDKIKVDTLLNNNNKNTENKIVLNTHNKLEVVHIKNIIRCEADDYYTKFFLVDGRKILISKTLKEHESLLKEFNFIRPHKSHLVNFECITAFMKNDGGYLLLNDGSKIPVSRRKKEMVVELLTRMK